MEKRKKYQVSFNDDESERIRKQATRQGLGFGTYIRNQMMLIVEEKEAQK